MSFGQMGKKLSSLGPTRAERTRHLHVLERFDHPNPVPSSVAPSDKWDENHRIHEDSEQCVPPWNAIKPVDYAKNEDEKP